jgi:hypothetical protein
MTDSLPFAAAARERPGMPQPWKPSLQLLVAMAIQMGAAIWWGSGLEARVASLEQRVPELAGVPAELARLDERSLAQSQSLQHLTETSDRTQTALTGSAARAPR